MTTDNTITQNSRPADDQVDHSVPRQSTPVAVSAVEPNARSAPSRLAWIDTARGLAILLVIFHHSVQFGKVEGTAHEGWVYLTAVLNTLRMPLFFFVSGLLATRAVTRGWGTLVAGRLQLLVWVFLVWVTLDYFWRVFVVAQESPQQHHLSHLGTDLLTANDTPIWYLYALALFLVTARLVRKVPTSIVLGVAAVAAVVFGADLIVLKSFAWSSMGTFFVFFLAGVRLHTPVVELTQRGIPRVVTVGVIGLYVGLTGVLFVGFGDDVLTVPGVRLVLSVIAVAVGCALALWMSNLRAARLFTRIGQMTLPFYVMHCAIIGSIMHLIAMLAEGRQLSVIGLVAPPVVAVVATAICFALLPVVTRLPGALSPPAPLARLVAGLSRA